ncbi:MAG: hypothetical protein QOH95_2141 [Gaiellaceae bacterium]|jgi:hypothetical protein|nr:hypothetical protein [Gaiellaceae bacterium]
MRPLLLLVLALAVAAPAAASAPKTYTLDLGRSMNRAGVHSGDWIVCRGLGTYVRTAVPGTAANTIRNVHVLTHELALDVSAPLHGRVRASCHRRP